MNMTHYCHTLHFVPSNTSLELSFVASDTISSHSICHVLHVSYTNISCQPAHKPWCAKKGTDMNANESRMLRSAFTEVARATKTLKTGTESWCEQEFYQSIAQSLSVSDTFIDGRYV